MLTDDHDPFDPEADPKLDEFRGAIKDVDPKRVAVIRTSDRINFRRCRRRWGWQSHLRGNLTNIEGISPLWFGSGIHFALEDFHGLKRWPHPKDAFRAYVRACVKAQKATGQSQLPLDWPDLCTLGEGMLTYYVDVWLVARNPLRTFVWKGQPQVEVHAVIEVPFRNAHYDRVLYAVTLDRVVIDDDGNLWILDYKTAKRIQTLHFQTDPQISAYCWVGSQLYDRPIHGFIYQQHRKEVPEAPRILGTGKISTASTLRTTHRLYRRALINLYGAVENAPADNIDYLNDLNAAEQPEQDIFIRRDRIYRNEHQNAAEGEKLLMELEEMLNPNLPLYPSPTRDCAGLCSFQSACVSVDDGGDWEHELEIMFRPKSPEFDYWRPYLEFPAA